MVGVDGMGKCLLVYDYCVMGWGNQGVVVQDLFCGVMLVVSFLVEDVDQIMVVIDGGQLICFLIDGVCIVGCLICGVCLICLNGEEQVVVVVCIEDVGDDEVVDVDGVIEGEVLEVFGDVGGEVLQGEQCVRCGIDFLCLYILSC